jgi:hypothetical protein
MLHSGKGDLAARSDEILRAEFGRRELTLVPLMVTVTDRMAELVETYASLRLGGVDALDLVQLPGNSPDALDHLLV